MFRIIITFCLITIVLVFLPAFFEYFSYTDSMDVAVNSTVVAFIFLTIFFIFKYNRRIRAIIILVVGSIAILLFCLTVFLLYPAMGLPVEYGDDINIKTDYPDYTTWERVKPGKVGIDEKIFDAALESYDSLDFVKSVIIIKNDKLVFEKYYNNAVPNKAYKVTSVSKSVTSSLIGIAVDKGLIDSIGQPISTLFPNYFYNISENDSRWLITIEDLLTMQSGFKFQQGQPRELTRGVNWTKKILTTEAERVPESSFRYGDHNTYLLASILLHTTGKSLEKFGNKHLFDPLGIEITYWEKCPKGIPDGSSGIYIRPIDLAKFGYLYLKRGKINEKQLINEEWIERSTSTFVSVDNSFGCVSNVGYGYGWWTANLSKFKVYMAIGSGGQLVINIPEIDMTFVQICNWNISDEKELEHSVLTSRIICKIIESISGNKRINNHKKL